MGARKVFERAQQRSTRATLKRRREEIVERLAARGLARGPHRVVRVAGAEFVEASHSLKLRVAFEELGPVFSAFGLYLSTRVDLLAARDCIEFASIRESAPPMSPPEARELFERGLGLSVSQIFQSFADAPFESRLFHQTHRTRLLNGESVLVKILREGLNERISIDLDLLGLLEAPLEGVLRGRASFRSAQEDFIATLRQQLDLSHEAKAMDTLARDVEDFQTLRAPAAHRALCSTGVLTYEELDGARLDEVSFNLKDDEDSGIERGRKRESVFDRTSLARLVCSVWLRQALLGRVFPIEPHASQIIILSDKQIAFAGGPYASLPGETQTNLWEYLIATAAENPDRACTCLLRELKPPVSANADENLRHRFRQIVPFRDSEWYRDSDVNHMAEDLIVHWRAANECGHKPHAHLPPFYRGLFSITNAAQSLSPENDPLIEGLQDVRLLSSFARMREMLTHKQLSDYADRYAAMLIAMPQRLDEMLTIASEGGARVKLNVPETTSHRRRENSSAKTTALILLLAAVALALPRITSTLFIAEWAERINALAFVMCGALLIGAASRGR